MKRKDPSPRVLRRLIDYCPDSGLLTWKPRPVWMYKTPGLSQRFNRSRAGKPALRTKSNLGYLMGQIFQRTHYAHRVAWAIYHGKWPENDIDHLNGDRADNSIKNLRDIPHSQNMRNRGLSKNNTSGHVGVSRTRVGTWRAEVRLSYGRVFSKNYATFEEACENQKRVAAQYGYTPRRRSKN